MVDVDFLQGDFTPFAATSRFYPSESMLVLENFKSLTLQEMRSLRDKYPRLINRMVFHLQTYKNASVYI